MMGFRGIRVASVLLTLFASSAQLGAEPRRLNKIIERLEKGEVAAGTFTSDESPDGAAAYARSPLDFLIYDMELSAIHFPGFPIFTQLLLEGFRIQIVGAAREAQAKTK